MATSSILQTFAGSLLVVFKRARHVRQGEELEHFQPAPEPEPPAGHAPTREREMTPKPA